MNILLAIDPKIYEQIKKELHHWRRYVKHTFTQATDETLKDIDTMSYDIAILDDMLIDRRKLRRIALKCYPKSFVCMITSKANGYNLQAMKKPFFDILYEYDDDRPTYNEIIALLKAALHTKWHDKRKSRF